MKTKSRSSIGASDITSVTTAPVYRLNEFRKRARPLDKTWTFGRQNLMTGYHLLAGVPVHRIVCSAFNGPATL